MDVVVLLVALAVFTGTWWWLVKQFRKSGRGFIVRHLLGSTGAWMLSFLVVGIGVSTGLVDATAPRSTQNSDAQQPAPVSSVVPPGAPTSIAQPQQPDQPNYRYSIIKEEYRPKLPRKVEVLLSRRLTDAELASLATKLKSDFKGTPSWTFIGFRVEGQNAPTYWANVRFDPAYSANVIGLSLADYEQLGFIDLSAYKELKGSWLRDGALGHLMVLYTINGKYFIDSVFADGGKNRDEYLAKRLPDGALRLETPDNGFGEYYVMSADGTLQGWGENGVYMTLLPRSPTKNGEGSHKET